MDIAPTQPERLTTDRVCPVWRSIARSPPENVFASQSPGACKSERKTRRVVMGEDWQRYANPRFRLEFRYPDPTPRSHEVERNEHRIHDERGEMERVHLSSPASGELYFELSRFVGISPQDEYASHRPFLEERFGAGAVTELAETTLLERRAWRYRIRWPEAERVVLLLPLDGDTYRVIYDPRSDLNQEVVATLSIAE
jgi:hypothetical protein